MFFWEFFLRERNYEVVIEFMGVLEVGIEGLGGILEVGFFE